MLLHMNVLDDFVVKYSLFVLIVSPMFCGWSTVQSTQGLCPTDSQMTSDAGSRFGSLSETVGRLCSVRGLCEILLH